MKPLFRFFRPGQPEVSPDQLLVEAKASDWNGDTLWGSNWSDSATPPRPGLPDGNGAVAQPEIGFPQFQPTGSPRLYEVHLTQRSLNGISALDASNLRAVITYGVGAANHEIVCDWRQGSRVIVPGGNISVKCRQIGPCTSILQLGVSIAAYAGGHVVHPTYTPAEFEYDWSAGGGAFRVAVPQRASRLYAYPQQVFSAATDETRVVHTSLVFQNEMYHTGMHPQLASAGIPLRGDCINIFGQLHPYVFPFANVRFELD